MAHVFVFVKDIENALKEGKTEIEFPEGVKISSAALDLMKERKIKVKYVSPKVEVGSESSETDDASAGQISAEKGEVKEVLDLKDDKGIKIVSEDDVEEITRRVLERFRQIRRDESAASGDKDFKKADDDDLIICRCEEITRGEIKEAIRNGMRTLNGIKRVTRAGMGLCQGQTCQRLVSQILASELGLRPGQLEPTTARAPVRPLKLSVLATG
jgi:bacterioferritin-associated ferredoxin